METPPLLSLSHIPSPPSHPHSPLRGLPDHVEPGVAGKREPEGEKMRMTIDCHTTWSTGLHEGVGIGIQNLACQIITTRKAKLSHRVFLDCSCLYFMTLSCPSANPHATLLKASMKMGQKWRDSVVGRVQRVGGFNFGTDRVRVLEKTSGSGLGMDRVRVLAPHFLSIGYYRVLKILIGYFSIKSMIRYFLLVQLRS